MCWRCLKLITVWLIIWPQNLEIIWPRKSGLSGWVKCIPVFVWITTTCVTQYGPLRILSLKAQNYVSYKMQKHVKGRYRHYLCISIFYIAVQAGNENQLKLLCWGLPEWSTSSTNHPPIVNISHSNVTIAMLWWCAHLELWMRNIRQFISVSLSCFTAPTKRWMLFQIGVIIRHPHAKPYPTHKQLIFN